MIRLQQKCHMLNKTSVFIQVEEAECTPVRASNFSQVPPIILTAPEKGSTLSWFQKRQPAGGCYDVLPFEKQEKG